MAVTLRTSLGDIKIELHCAEVPRTCANFLALAASGKYDGTIFHRSMRGFMLQGGDTDHRYGKGGKSIWGGYFNDEFHPKLRHSARGVVSMANKGANKNGSQFFITYGAQPHLDNVYTVFGQVIHGATTVLDAIEKIPVEGKKCRPTRDVVVHSIHIHANPLADRDLRELGTFVPGANGVAQPGQPKATAGGGAGGGAGAGAGDGDEPPRKKQRRLNKGAQKEATEAATGLAGMFASAKTTSTNQ